MPGEKTKFLASWSSPFCLRILWALKLKGIEYEYIEQDLSNKSSLLLQYNPIHKKVPVLVHNGEPVAESLVILEYMEDTWKQNPLLPTDPYKKAVARFWAKFVDKQAFSKEGKEQEEHLVEAMQNLRLLEEVLEEKKFFGGEMIGYVDVILGSIISMSNVLDEITGIKKIDGEKFPLLSAWMENFFTSEMVVNTLPPHDRMVIKMKAMRNYRTKN